MEQMVTFRDFQEQTAADHNNIQLFARHSFDDVINDAVTHTVRYSGFNTVKSNQAEITVAVGRFYGANIEGQIGAVYPKRTATIISMVAYLAVSTQKIVTLTASGVENESDTETRDFLTNVTTGQTEPQAVPMQSSRDGVLNLVSGAEAPVPQAPAIPAGQVAIANILMDTSGVVSITMLPAGLVTSTENLNGRVMSIEDFDAQIAPRVTALASDLAALQLKMLNQANKEFMIEISRDIALLKAKDGLPATHASYGASYLLWNDPTFVDTTDAQSRGEHCLVEYGARFPSQNANLFALSLFNSLDPTLAYAGNGLLLPAYDSVKKLSTAGNLAAPTDHVTIGQYGYQTFNYKEIDIPYQRIRNGGTYFQCSNGAAGFIQPPDGNVQPYWLPHFSSYQVQSGFSSNFNADHNINLTDYLWVDSWTQPYWTLEATTNTVNGALIAQTFLMSNDTWITKLGIWINSIASQTDIVLTLCQTTNGQPDLDKTIARGTLTGASLALGMNYLTLMPTYAQKGDRLAVVVTSTANHGLGLAPAGTYLNGSFFYSLDGVYFLGDFSKEMFLEVWGAKFRSSQTVAEFSALSLAGGIRAIDLTARVTLPDSCEIIYEVMPDGTNTWIPISVNDPLAPWSGAPVLARFRARMIGTPDIAPGIRLPDSICKIWAPGTDFKFVTLNQTLAAATTSITLQFYVENYDTIAHTITPKVFVGGGSLVTAGAVTTVLDDASRKRYKITATFTISSADHFSIYIQGTTNSVSNVFHIAQLLWWSL